MKNQKESASTRKNPIKMISSGGRLLPSIQAHSVSLLLCPMLEIAESFLVSKQHENDGRVDSGGALVCGKLLVEIRIDGGCE